MHMSGISGTAQLIVLEQTNARINQHNLSRMEGHPVKKALKKIMKFGNIVDTFLYSLLYNVN